MCDYSLELYDSRPARAGEIYVTTRFPTGSTGLAAPSERDTAVCISCGTRLTLENISEEKQAALGVGPTESVTFVALKEGLYRDGVEFSNGLRVALNRLGTGVMVSLADAPIASEPARRQPIVEAEVEPLRETELEPAE
jgi:hypothetical protein